MMNTSNLNNKEKLTGVAETMLIPLYSRALETQKNSPLIKDEKALEMVSKINYDFKKMNKAWMTHTGVIARTLLLDREVKKFINENPDCVCISIGCGLDTRFYRLDNKKITWYNLDLPEVIKIRKRFFTNTKRVNMIGKSVFKEDWVNLINAKNKKVLIILEGILMYFTENEVKKLLTVFKNNFKNCTILMELMSPYVSKHSKYHDTVKNTSVVFKWGVKTGKDVENLCPGLRLINEWNLFDVPRSLWGWVGVLIKIPPFSLFKKLNNRIALYELN